MQEQTGGAGEGERQRDSRGWEPTSPWSKDRPPVCPKNTCEFLKQGVGTESTHPNTSSVLLCAVLRLFMAPRRPAAQH